MTRLQRDRLGRWSLRIDAAYCLVLGVAIALGAGPVAHLVGLPPAVISVVGLVVVAWAGGVCWMLTRLPSRVALRVVMTANVLAAVAVASASVAVATALVAVALLTVAVDVALFATSQAVALRGVPPAVAPL